MLDITGFMTNYPYTVGDDYKAYFLNAARALDISATELLELTSVVMEDIVASLQEISFLSQGDFKLYFIYTTTHNGNRARGEFGLYSEQTYPIDIETAELFLEELNKLEQTIAYNLASGTYMVDVCLAEGDNTPTLIKKHLGELDGEGPKKYCNAGCFIIHLKKAD